MSSTRLPGKVMAEINGFPMIYWQIRRIHEAVQVDKLVLATTIHHSDDVLSDFVNQIGVEVFRGSVDDVHSRFRDLIEKNSQFENIVRLTGDCPMTMPKLLDEMIVAFEHQNLDYYSNCNPPTFPDGLDIEIFSRQAFIRLSNAALSASEKEHVTLGFLNRAEDLSLIHI